MTDSIVDDVQVLLDKELGDKRILAQILRAAQNNEVISNFERNYVQKLVEKYLRPKPAPEKKIPETPKPTVPEVEFPPTIKPQTEQIWSQPAKVSKPTSKNNFILLGVGIAVLAIIIVAAVSMSDLSGTTPINNTPNQISSTSQSFSIVSDSTFYEKGDIISINGKSDLPLGSQINLSIENTKKEKVWTEQINTKRDGQFTTLTFAGGPGWENAGIFTITAESGPDKAASKFTFGG